MTGRERKFVEEYLIDLNAYAAAMRAGYAQNTAKNASMWIDGARPLKPKLREEIEKRMAERSKRTGVTADRVILELARIAFANVTDVVDAKTGRVLEDANREDTAAIAGIRMKNGEDYTEAEVKFADKLKALELLGKHMGMWVDNVKIDGSVPVIVDDTDAPEDAPSGKIGDE